MAAIPVGASRPRRTLIWADYWTFFTGQQSRDATWELVKFMVGPDGQKHYPIGTGAMSGLKSLAGYWTETKQKELGIGADELKVAAQGVDVQHVSADNFTINWPELWDAIKDAVAGVLAGQVPAKQGLGEVAPAAEAAIQRSLPK
jgi:ABC-type glycerol-3-phosphate transport system substrate-binding protein